MLELLTLTLNWVTPSPLSPACGPMEGSLPSIIAQECPTVKRVSVTAATVSDPFLMFRSATWWVSAAKAPRPVMAAAVQHGMAGRRCTRGHTGVHIPGWVCTGHGREASIPTMVPLS